MPIIYMCPTGTLSSLIAANLHIGRINIHSQLNELKNLPYLNIRPDNPGFFLYVGKDNFANHIYTLGVGNEAKLIMRSSNDFLKMFPEKRNIVFHDFSKFLPKSFILNLAGGTFLIKNLYKDLSKISKEVVKIKEIVDRG